MPLIPAKCTQCGANIRVDDSKEAGICEYCGTAFITEKAINNYNTYVTNNYAGANINIIHQDNPDYMCPQCQSSDIKALKVLKKGRPTYESYSYQYFGFTILAASLVFAGIGALLAGKIVTSIGIILLAILSGMIAFGSYKLEKKSYSDYKKAYAKWLQSYQCMRCGKIFVIDDKPKT